MNARIYLAKSYVALSQFDNAEQTLTEGIERLQDESAFYLELFDAKHICMDSHFHSCTHI